MTITKTEYSTLEQAFDYFNSVLFNNKLPAVMITLQHSKQFNGYCWKDKFSVRGIEGNNTKTYEIALNPDNFRGRTDKDILSTLVHEMVHVAHYETGKAPKGGYHDKKWGMMMKLIGLHPSNTGAVGGKETGNRMSHYIITGAAFDTYCDALLADGFKLGWQSHMEEGKAKKKKQTRAKFVCPECNQAAWAAHSANLVCGDCNVSLLKQESEGENDNG